MHASAAAMLLQLCPTLCDPIDGSPPGSPVPGILQARTLEWVAISFSNALKWKVKVKLLSSVRLFPTPWTAYQAPPSMGFSRESTGVGSHTFSRGSAQPRDWIQVSCIAGRYFFTIWATREAPNILDITPTSSYNQGKSCNLSRYIHMSLNQAKASVIKNLKINR